MFEDVSESKVNMDSPNTSTCSLETQLGRKIIDKIHESTAKGKTLYSFEYFPPKTDAGVNNLYARIHRMNTDLAPAFIDVTWGAGGSTADLTLDIVNVAQNHCHAETMMHLTCTNMHIDQVKDALHKAKAYGIRNILALRGDPPHGVEVWEQSEGGLKNAVDLVRLIRQEHGDYFGIAVAGYPEGHLQCESLEQDILYLKEKLDAGADFVITQLFYDCEVFKTWVEKCRAVGITAPIVPGILPIQNYSGFHRMIGFCKTYVPQHILDALEEIKDDDAAVKEYGVKLAIDMCTELLAQKVPCLHFYTLNLEYSCQLVLQELGYISPTSPTRDFPWKQSCIGSRKCKELVRPVFWSNRPASFEVRTRNWNWDEFSNGRWGNANSPAFGELTNYHLCSIRAGTAAEREALWGTPQSLQDIYNTFAKYVQGEINRLPWCESALSAETDLVKQELINLNKRGFLTINSQPSVNGVPSSDPVHGWGGNTGYVYQKAYVEFFVSSEQFAKLEALIPSYPTLAYLASNNANERRGNYENLYSGITTVTWGVFPNKEVQQPTVIDNTAFGIWKEEAFALWSSQWESVYPADSTSAKLIRDIKQDYWLVTIVDHDYINGNIFAIFDALQ